MAQTPDITVFRAQTRDVTILRNDSVGDEDWPSPPRVEDDGVLEAAKNLIIVSRLSRLSEVAQHVRKASSSHRLRGLLIRSDIDPIRATIALDVANVRTLRNLLVHRGYDIPRRVLEAWAAGAQSRLIADATVINGQLFVIGCDFERIGVALSAIEPLVEASDSEQRNFEVDEDGSFLYWPDLDVHLDRRALEAYADPEVRRQRELEKLARNLRFGDAVRGLRERAKLTQSQVSGVSERQVRRIEEGHRPKLSTLRKIAAAMQVSLSDFLRVLAREIYSKSQTDKLESKAP